MSEQNPQRTRRKRWRVSEPCAEVPGNVISIATAPLIGKLNQTLCLELRIRRKSEEKMLRTAEIILPRLPVLRGLRSKASTTKPAIVKCGSGGEIGGFAKTVKCLTSGGGTLIVKFWGLFWLSFAECITLQTHPAKFPRAEPPPPWMPRDDHVVGPRERWKTTIISA